jgi:ubiquinone/menaquinone biosynthesis C-methylase UbiE
LGSQKLPALREVNRVLKDKGRFLLIVIVPSLLMFFVAPFVSFVLFSRKSWHKLFAQSNFHLVDEGTINLGAYFLLEKGVADAF